MKVFLSHSSVQKTYIRCVADSLGRGVAILDEYTLEAGRDLWTEIRKAISSCDIFVLFISKEALVSDWVKEELGYVRDLVDSNEIRFMAFIVDETSPTDSEIKPWIKNILLKTLPSPEFVSRNIRRAIHDLLLERHQEVNLHGQLFEGRDVDMGRLRKELNKDLHGKLRALIISGLPGSGRKRMLRQTINMHMRSQRDLNYEPIYITIGENESLAEIIGLLNDQTKTFDSNRLLDKLSSKEGMIDAAVEVFNAIADVGERVVIDDNGAIVLRNGDLVDWFMDLMHDKRLTPQIHLFVAARNAVPVHKSISMVELMSQSIGFIDLDSMRSLLMAYCRLKDVDLDAEDRNDFLNKFKGYPDVLYNTIDVLSSGTIADAKKYLTQNALSNHRGEISERVNEIRVDSNKYQLLVLLSHFDFIKFASLVDIFGEGEDIVLETLDDLARAGLCEIFGKRRDYIRLAAPVHDYLTRNKSITLDNKYRTRLRNKLVDYITILKTGDDTPSDFGETLMAIKETIRKNNVGNIAKKLLVPTFVLKVVMEEYNARNYEIARSLARKVLYDYHQNNYDSLLAPLRYWMCLAMARLHDEKVIEEAEQLNDYKKYFVRGFYYSHLDRPNYRQAAIEYEKALKKQNMIDRYDCIKAKHQLVIAWQHMNRYDDAVAFSLDCYDSDPTNPYYIQAYFESVVKSKNPDPNILKGLIERMNSIHEINSGSLATGMEAQLSYYSYHNYSRAKDILRDAITNEPLSRNRDTLLRIFKEIALANNDLAAYDVVNRQYGTKR